MKKLISCLIVLALSLCALGASAADMGVQIIGGGDAFSDTVSLDDVQLGVEVEVPGWGTVTPIEYAQQDCAMVRKPGQLGLIWVWSDSGTHGVDGYDHSIGFYMKVDCEPHGDSKYPYWSEEWVTHCQTGTQADYALLYMDILNSTAESRDYLKDYSVKVVFDDEVEYAGWCYQQNYDLNRTTWIDPEDNFVIEPYYTGHYVFGCTLPNAIFTSDKPLRMEITIDGNEIVYNARK